MFLFLIFVFMFRLKITFHHQFSRFFQEQQRHNKWNRRKFQKTKNIMRHTLANKVIFLEIRFLNVTTNIAYWKFPSINYICNITYSDGSGTRNRCFRLWKCSEEMGVRPVWQDFSSFVNKFLAYVLDDFLKRSDPKVLRNFGK